MTEIENTLKSKFPHRGTGGFVYSLHLADNALILGQRNSEWCAHGPVLEQDIAITNISLDLLGQARNFYQYAASLYNKFSHKEKEAVDYLLPRPWKDYYRELTEDDLAFLRDEHQYLNLLITELPNGDWAQTILRQFFFSAYQQLLYTQLQKNSDEQLSAIAEKSLKEVNYHLRWSSEWVIRLGDGTYESHQKMNNALGELWMYTAELFIPASYELIDVSKLKEAWQEKINKVFQEATLTSPFSPALGAREEPGVRFSGKQGKHTEYFGYILTEMQYLQRAYPNFQW
jgi:ring-1,2-phenylacetyl-CoA epoxidase subunit PaaC